MRKEDIQFVKNTLQWLNRLREFAVKKAKPVLPPAISVEIHLENNLSFNYDKYKDRFTFYILPEKIHKIKGTDIELNPIIYYHEKGDDRDPYPLVRKLLELATIGVFHYVMIEKYLMENS